MNSYQQESLEFIKEFKRWPSYPLLPIKRYVDHKFQGAVLFHSSEGLKVGVDLNIWDLPKEFVPEQWQPATPEALIEEGWAVD